MHPNVSVRNVAGFNIPQFDFVDIAYVSSTNNISSIVYKEGGSGGTTVATLTFTYIGGTPSADDAKIDTITKS